MSITVQVKHCLFFNVWKVEKYTAMKKNKLLLPEISFIYDVQIRTIIRGIYCMIPLYKFSEQIKTIHRISMFGEEVDWQVG